MATFNGVPVSFGNVNGSQIEVSSNNKFIVKVDKTFGTRLSCVRLYGDVTDIVIPDNYLGSPIVRIGADVFRRLDKLQSITLPKDCYEVGERCFSGCKSLKSIEILGSHAIWDNICFQAFSNCVNLERVNLPQIKEIMHYVFSSCKKLKEVNCPKVTTIGTSAFQYCDSLTSINFPSIQTLGNQVFYKCKNLTSVTLGSDIKSIDSYAFDTQGEANSLTVTVQALTPPKLGTYSSFNKKYLKQIIVPIGCGETYKAATGWTTYADYIVETATQTLGELSGETLTDLGDKLLSEL